MKTLTEASPNEVSDLDLTRKLHGKGGKLEGILPRPKSKVGKIRRESRLHWGGARRAAKFGGHVRAKECGRE